MMASDRSGRGLGAGSKQGTTAFDDNLQIGDPSVALVGPDQGAATVTLSIAAQAVGGDVSLTVEVTTVTPQDAPQDVGLMAQAATPPFSISIKCGRICASRASTERACRWR